jgi:hypothetical protein
MYVLLEMKDMAAAHQPGWQDKQTHKQTKQTKKKKKLTKQTKQTKLTKLAKQTNKQTNTHTNTQTDRQTVFKLQLDYNNMYLTEKL